MLRTIENQEVQVSDLLPFSLAGVHLLPSAMYSTTSLFPRLPGFARCCNSWRLFLIARFLHSASSLGTWRLQKMGLPNDCILRADWRTTRPWFGCDICRRFVLVLFVTYLPSRVTSPIAVLTLMCFFRTSSKSCSCGQWASLLLDLEVFWFEDCLCFFWQGWSLLHSERFQCLTGLQVCLEHEGFDFRDKVCQVSQSFLAFVLAGFSFPIPWWACGVVSSTHSLHTKLSFFPSAVVLLIASSLS